MLISHHSGRAFQSRLLSHCKNRPRRTLFTETLQSCTNAYLDLAMGLPYPPTWPVYSCTIVLVGVASRVALLPVFLWAWKRERRVKENVVPYLKAYRARLEERAQQQLVKADSEAARDYFNHIITKRLKTKRDELFKLHNCTPWITMLVPPISQIPIFVLLSATFLHAANEPGSVLRNEEFLTLNSLAHPDPTVVLPIALGLISLASIETSGWFTSEEQSRRFAEVRRREQTRRAHGKIVIQPMKYVRSILRGLSVGRIILASMAPGSIEIYWLTSATFGLFTNWAMHYNDSRRELTRKSHSESIPRNGQIQT
ncbi:60Kd inner membrane protein-domain-containing protein [Gautieria morchelliformis]|nr:60Kd inner membrane protein-domain-containing protein [Gautieria morchelliformis]